MSGEVENWGSGEWVAFGGTIALVVGVLFLLWQSPRSRAGIGLALLWRRLRGRR